MSVNLDSFETVDERNITEGIGFSIEPGIYLDDFGVRSEINVFINDQNPEITTPIQNEIITITNEIQSLRDLNNNLNSSMGEHRSI